MVPTTRAFKDCSTRFDTVLVNEFRTTIVYNGDKDYVLQSVERRNTGRKVRGLLWWHSTIPNQSKFVDRDLNAALNIRDCFLCEERPGLLR